MRNHALPLNILLSKKANEYSYYGVKLPSVKNVTTLTNSEKESSLFIAAANQVNGEDQSVLFASATPTSRTNTGTFEDNIQMSAQTVVRIDVVLPESTCISKEKIESIASFLSQTCTINMLLENFIASIVTLSQNNCSTGTAQGLLTPVVINTICMTYTQYKLIIDGFIKARSGQTDVDTTQALLTRHQMQAIAGLLSAIEDGVRLFFMSMVVFNQTSPTLRSTLAGLIGVGKFGSFLMANGHKTCDAPFGKTYIGNVVYWFLTSPVAPDFVQYITTTMPLVGGAIFFSVIITIKDMLNSENIAVSVSLNTLAFFSGMMGFLVQKSYICEVINKNVNANRESITDWNKFWYGETNNANVLQMTSHVIKRIMDISMALPLATLDMANKLLSILCYFVLAILPIQLVAMCQYIAQPAFVYCIFYQVFNDTQGLVKTYIGKDTSSLTVEMQYLLTLVCSIPLGLATSFTVLNLTGEPILKGTNSVYGSNSNPVTWSDIAPSTSESALLPIEDPLPSPTVYSRLGNVIMYSKDSIKTVFNGMIAQFKGENKNVNGSK